MSKEEHFQCACCGGIKKFQFMAERLGTVRVESLDELAEAWGLTDEQRQCMDSLKVLLIEHELLDWHGDKEGGQVIMLFEDDLRLYANEAVRRAKRLAEVGVVSKILVPEEYDDFVF